MIEENTFTVMIHVIEFDGFLFVFWRGIRGERVALCSRFRLRRISRSRHVSDGLIGRRFRLYLSCQTGYRRMPSTPSSHLLRDLKSLSFLAAWTVPTLSLTHSLFLLRFSLPGKLWRRKSSFLSLCATTDREPCRQKSWGKTDYKVREKKGTCLELWKSGEDFKQDSD